MKSLKSYLLAIPFLILSFTGPKVFASHIPGANITYTCNPANPLEYTFTFTIFRKCPGTHPATMTSTNFTLTNDCGLANPIVPTFNQVGVAEDVNQLCATATSNCSGGTQPGVWRYTYEATIVFPADCDSWNLAFDLCCRDQSSNLTGTTSNNMATSTTMNTLTAPCNNSPVVTAQPIPYACTNTNFNYCLTTADPEGDSTYYSMVAPAGAGQTGIASLAGYSATAPLTGFVLDPLTGCFSFNEPNIGNYVVSIQINSYNAAGNLIASIIHDFQVMVISCTNTPPTNPSGGISNVNGTGTQVGPNTVAACFGDNICFDVVFQDLVDPGNNITIQQDGTTLLPGATFTQTGTNPATGTFCWTSQPGYTGSVVTFTAQDDGCPVMGTSGFGVNFNITTGVFAGADETICGAQSATLSANGAGAYTWTPAAGLSCTNCPNPVATPASTTTYTVTGNLTGVCMNTDQVTVNVVPDFALNMNPANATICANEIIQLNANGQAGFGPFIYNWDNSSTLNNDSIINPLANPLSSTIYTSTVTAANGCTKDITANITVSGIGPTVTVTPSDTDICAGESVPLITSSFVYPVVCGLSSGCSGTGSTVDLGTATTATTSYTPFYGSTATTTNYTNKSQFIYTAAELNALGYFGGTIENLSLYFTSTTAYQWDNVEIYIACTSQDQFTSTSFTPVTGMTQVFNGSNISPVNNGWQTFNITDWDWDGSSNLIIQMCAQEDNTNDEGSETVRYSTTSPAYRCIYDHATLATAPSCDELIGSRTTLRPNMRFGMCVESVSSPSYSWTTTTGLNNPSIANPTATPATTTSYVLGVTASGCTGSVIANINVSPDYTINPSATPSSLCNGLSTSLLGNTSAGGPYSYSWSPAGAFTNPNAANPTLTPSGTTTYYLSTSNGFCNKTDSITVNVGGLPISAIVSDDTVCQGSTINLSTLSAAATCGVNYSNCTGTTNTAYSAIGTAASSTYGPFYGSTSTTLVYTNKKQYIFTAAELTAMGYTAGMITELALDVSTATGRAYDNMEIWMGCTTQEDYPNTTFIPNASLSQVYSTPKYTTTTGWNAFSITGYDWDGSSNLVVQFCSDNADQTGSESVRYTSTTPVYKMLYYNTSTAGACTNATGTRNYNRPNMRFKMCSSSFGAGTTYSWSGAAVSNSSIQTPTATVFGNTSYTVTATDPANPGCPTSGTINVYLDNTNTVVASDDTTYCIGDPAFNLNAQFMLNGVPSSAGTGLACYDQTISYVNPALLNGTNNFNFAGTPPVATGGTLTITTYGDVDGAVGGTNEEMWTIQDENSNTIGTAGGSNTQCGFTHTVVVPLSAAQLNAWSANGSIDFAGIDVAGNVNATLCGAGQDLLTLRLEIDCPVVGSGYTWSPATYLSSTTVQNPTVTPLGPMTYVVTATGGACDAYDTVNVIICSVLPIEMTSFNVMCEEERVLLDWTTATEINNNYFIIERSTNAIDFTSIGKIIGNGNSTSTNEYRFIDNKPLNEVSYYRLKQVDFNGDFEYHDMKSVNCKQQGNISIYPNPFKNNFTVQLEDISNQPVTIEVIDYLGRTVYNEITENNTTIIEIEELPAGTYFVKVFNGNSQIIERISKMK